MELASSMSAGHVYQGSHHSHFASVKGLNIMPPGDGITSDLAMWTITRVNSMCE